MEIFMQFKGSKMSLYSGMPSKVNGGGGIQTPPLFQNMILEICPIMLDNFSTRVFPCICKLLKGMVQKFLGLCPGALEAVWSGGGSC